VVIVTGAGLGALLGVTEGNSKYLVIQAARLEVDLLLALLACLFAGACPAWRRAVIRGVFCAGALAAVQIIVAFFFTLQTGSDFWSLFPFGGRTDDAGTLLSSGDFAAALRQNAVPAFLVLPPLCLVATRLKQRDVFIGGVLLTASIVWLSRGFWVATGATLALIAAFRVTKQGVELGTLMRRIAPVMLITATVLVIAGGVIEHRFNEATTSNRSNNLSNQFRAAETSAALDRLESSPFHFVFGLGTGELVTHPYINYRPALSALLENGVLSEWVNGGLAFMLGSAVLFFGAALRGWGMASRHGLGTPLGALGAMSLALPALWLEGLVGGTLTLVEPAVVLWLLAGTVLATPQSVITHSPRQDISAAISTRRRPLLKTSSVPWRAQASLETNAGKTQAQRH